MFTEFSIVLLIGVSSSFSKGVPLDVSIVSGSGPIVLRQRALGCTHLVTMDCEEA